MTPTDYAVAAGAGAFTGFVCAVPVGPINVAIIGAGATGVELSAELHHAAQLLRAYGDGLETEAALEQVQEETQGDVDREALLAATDERLKRVRGVGHVIKTSRAQLAKWATEAGFQQAVGQNKE